VVKIRNAELSDIENLTVLKLQVWIATYATEGIRKEFADYVLSEFTIEKTQNTILDTNLITLIAESDNHLIGCIEIKFNSIDAIPQVKDHPEISVLYVLERFFRVGVGTKLLKEALSIIKKMNFHSAWLSVYYKNERAISFYRKNNFDIIGATFFKMQKNQYENKVMVCNF